jgi:hypothetical protein
METEIRELLLSNDFRETGLGSGIYELGEYKIYFLQSPWTVKNWLTIERIQNKSRFIKFNSQINSIDDIKFLIKLIMKKQFDAH